MIAKPQYHPEINVTLTSPKRSLLRSLAPASSHARARGPAWVLRSLYLSIQVLNAFSGHLHKSYLPP